jgi:hypothetical protein
MEVIAKVVIDSSKLLLSEHTVCRKPVYGSMSCKMYLTQVQKTYPELIIDEAMYSMVDGMNMDDSDHDVSGTVLVHKKCLTHSDVLRETSRLGIKREYSFSEALLLVPQLMICNFFYQGGEKLTLYIKDELCGSKMRFLFYRSRLPGKSFGIHARILSPTGGCWYRDLPIETIGVLM